MLASSTNAWVPGEPLVPCGGAGQPTCTKCELLHLVDNLADFIMIALAPIVATLFFVVAGVYIMLGGANPSMLSQGKSMFTNALTGLIIVMLAWLITNTLLTTLLTASIPIDSPSGNYNFQSADWWILQCNQVGL